MAIIKQAVYKVDNGMDYDVIHFQTEGSMVKTQGGTSTVEEDLETLNSHTHTTLDNGLKIKGTGTGVTNISGVGFYESDETTRKGYIGDGASGDENITIASDAGNIKLQVPSDKEIYALVGISMRKVFHEGNYIEFLATNGYEKTPGGKIRQWGTVSVPTGGTTVTLPIAFATVVYSVNPSANSSTGAVVVNYYNPTTTQFSLKHNSASTITVTWEAIGV